VDFSSRSGVDHEIAERGRGRRGVVTASSSWLI
jgi:hypothetical protein